MSNAALRRAWGERAAGWLRSSPNDRIGRDRGSERLIAAARIAPGMHTLDLGTGAGEPALGIAKIAASVTCADLAFEMLQGARGRARDIGLANLRYVSADMEALPFADASFDAATCRFGIMFPGDPVRAASEVRRALKPGATAAFLVHGPHHEQTVYAVVHDTALRFFGLPGDPAESLRYRYQEQGALGALLRAAGYQSVAEQELKDSVAVAPGTRFWKSALDRAFGHRIDMLDQAGRARLEAEILKGFEPYRSGEGYRVGLLMRLGTGQA